MGTRDGRVALQQSTNFRLAGTTTIWGFDPPGHLKSHRTKIRESAPLGYSGVLVQRTHGCVSTNYPFGNARCTMHMFHAATSILEAASLAPATPRSACRSASASLRRLESSSSRCLPSSSALARWEALATTASGSPASLRGEKDKLGLEARGNDHRG